MNNKQRKILKDAWHNLMIGLGAKMWTYKGINIYRNISGIRYYAYTGAGLCLKADTKEGMKQLINEGLTKAPK